MKSKNLIGGMLSLSLFLVGSLAASSQTLPRSQEVTPALVTAAEKGDVRDSFCERAGNF